MSLGYFNTINAIFLFHVKVKKFVLLQLCYLSNHFDLLKNEKEIIIVYDDLS